MLNKLSQLSLKLKIILLSALIVAALLILGLSALGQLGAFNDGVNRSLDMIRARVAILTAVEQAHVSFKVQVQEWKNVLIRGNNPDLYAKYVKQFGAEEQQVQQHLANAIQQSGAALLPVQELQKVKTARGFVFVRSCWIHAKTKKYFQILVLETHQPSHIQSFHGFLTFGHLKKTCSKLCARQLAIRFGKRKVKLKSS